MEELEIFDDKEKLTIGVRLSKEYEGKIEIYVYDPYYGHGMNVSLEDAIKLRDKLDSLIHTITRQNQIRSSFDKVVEQNDEALRRLED